MFSHNHPSGKAKPSCDDINLTANLKVGALIIIINLIDPIKFNNQVIIQLRMMVL